MSDLVSPLLLVVEKKERMKEIEKGSCTSTGDLPIQEKMEVEQWW